MHAVRIHPRSLGVITFPIFVSALGGAQFVDYTKRCAFVTLANGDKVRVPRKLLDPEPGNWTAFKLAEVAAEVAAKEQS